MSNTPAAQRTPLRRKVLLGFGVVLLMLVIIATISVQSTRSESFMTNLLNDS